MSRRQDDVKLNARAERFGIDASAESKKQPARKRGAPAEPVDPEELERRKKRAERFGLPLAVSPNLPRAPASLDIQPPFLHRAPQKLENYCRSLLV